MTQPLTPKQEKFAQLYVELGDASAAYRQSYSAENMKAATVNRNAKALLDNNKIATRVGEIRQQLAKKHSITLDDLMRELEEARELARTNNKSAPMVSATMGKAKLLGMDKQVVDLTNSDGSLRPQVIRRVIVRAKP